MSLSGIFDPVVRAYFKNHGGGSGGSAVDDGYCIRWDGNTEGRTALIGMEILGMYPSYKVSNKVFTAEELGGGSVHVHSNSLESVEEINEITDLGGVIAYGPGYIVSGKSGTYNVMGVDVIVPEDGTYFALLANFGTFIDEIVKPASV